MKNWENAVEKFIAPWKRKKYVEGIIMAGSYVMGTQTPQSDIDFHIVLADEIGWRERGNKRVDGIIMEYFANPVRQIYQYMKEDPKSYRRADARMYAGGRILFDRNGEVGKLKEFAKKELKKKFKRPGHLRVEIMKYGLWDRLDGLADLLADNSPIFPVQFSLILEKTVWHYAEYLMVKLPPITKLDKYFHSVDFRKKYRIDKFPDGKFIKLFNDSLTAKNNQTKFTTIKELVEYVQKKMGGFDINHWKVRSRVD